MVILKYELKRHRTYILGWTIALAVCIFLMTPTYYSFLDVASVELFETMGTTDFYRIVGVSMEYLTSPLGIYGFLTSFFMIASGVFGMHFGISVHTRECTEGTSEYLFTKPFPRKTIYWAKALTVLIGVVVVGAAYLLASFWPWQCFVPELHGESFSDCSVPHPCYAVLCCNGSDGGNFVSPQP